ncbi:cytochrome c oxidase subunit 3 [Chelativorans salis]|uniref:cytochrome-c oxidase n=1 Tax=Chelativorans salis TaxID=2978478 RepID=A0ABT2LNZ4_9HYPH|nr:cytochrome c oxidase subunit 3 [Chelativorans sp. EGI FJ00035]MCT7376281.1 cytochrome c oxidase subunit 3 [Chelativorans sp. EGI FJ00035]
MHSHAGYDARELTRFAHKTHPLWWGILGVVTIEATVVASLIASYFYLRMDAEAWPPPGVDPPGLLFPTINLVLLVTSSGTMYWAGWGINRENKLVLTLGTSASVALASLVLVLRGIELSDLGFLWNSHPYGSIVWTMMGFHFVHVVSAIIGTAVVAFLAGIGYFTRERQLGVVVDTLYWYFVAGIWIPLYLVLCWAPRVL